MSKSSSRSSLGRLTRYFALVSGAAVLYVMFDFAFDLRPSAVQSSYRFEIAGLALDEARILRQDNLQILVIRRSADTIRKLTQQLAGLQDAGSQQSNQPEFAANPLRSRQPEYFVSYAIGTDLGCGLVVTAPVLREICGQASYDFAGRALKGENRFPNLLIPDYNFTNNFNTLTIKP